MINSLDIINQGKISSAFIKANRFLLEKFDAEFTAADCKNKKLEELWNSEFNSVLQKDPATNAYVQAIFKDTESLTVFLLRWS